MRALLVVVIPALLAVASTSLAEPATPGQESGRVDTQAPSEPPGRLVLRGALYIPRLVADAALTPVEGLIWVTERYQLAERIHRLLWNDSNTFGILPTAQLEAGFGINLGAHLVARDVLGKGRRFDLRTSGGGRFSQRYVAQLTNRWGSRISSGLELEYERRPRDPFYGIGNADEGASEMTLDPVDPIAGRESRYRHDIARVLVHNDLRVAGDLHVRTASSYSDHELAGTEVDKSISDRYTTAALPGFTGYRASYSELELRWDSRRTADATESASNFSTGWLASVFAGRVHVFGERPDFFRYGGDLQRFLWLAHGPRVLMVRLHLEGVTGALDDTPFTELPRLGGRDLLRGYTADRFRDRLAVLGSVEYRWDLSRALSASLFVDAGRTYRDLGGLALEDLRVGYGMALEAHSDKSFLARIGLSSSADGGVFLDFSLDPVFAVVERVQRK